MFDLLFEYYNILAFNFLRRIDVKKNTDVKSFYVDKIQF